MSELTVFLEARLADDVITFRLENCAKCLTYQHAPDDPATERFMAEVEAKRAIVARAGAVEVGYPSYHLAQGVLRLLAAPYRDHPGYQEGWAL